MTEDKLKIDHLPFCFYVLILYFDYLLLLMRQTNPNEFMSFLAINKMATHLHCLDTWLFSCCSMPIR